MFCRRPPSSVVASEAGCARAREGGTERGFKGIARSQCNRWPSCNYDTSNPTERTGKAKQGSGTGRAGARPGRTGPAARGQHSIGAGRTYRLRTDAPSTVSDPPAIHQRPPRPATGTQARRERARPSLALAATRCCTTYDGAPAAPAPPRPAPAPPSFGRAKRSRLVGARD